ncbi:UDP-glycosyltransferase 71A16-like [Pistacia vera]|uniref:UDP-glycosyltransferase 71A16-like n=1 Tax=Pistacia vera TaxID=55513 RepID=UPI00126348D5|nr:UDP-glycosyltransferase 71A16-like [Pistacia vera]
MKLPSDAKINAYLDAVPAANRINFVQLPNDQIPLPGSNPRKFFPLYIESHKPHVKAAVAKLLHSESASDDSPRLSGFVFDMFWSLGLMFHAHALYDDQNMHTAELKDSDTELEVPSLINPIPAKVLPSTYLEKDWSMIVFEQARRARRVKGIVVNSFMELE